MSEKEFDSSHIAYEENPNKELPNQGKWNMAIGLQKIDKLEPSECLKQLSQNNIEGVISVEQVKEGLRAYYIEKEKEHQINPNEYECDFVSTRIVEILNIDQFELSIDYLKKNSSIYISGYLPIYWAVSNCELFQTRENIKQKFCSLW